MKKIDHMVNTVPYYDVWRDEIMNVTDKTSYSYYHEYRHKMQNRIKFIRFTLIEYPFFLTTMSWVMMLCTLTFFLMKHIPLTEFSIQVFAIIHVIWLIFQGALEIDALIYGLRNARGFWKK